MIKIVLILWLIGGGMLAQANNRNDVYYLMKRDSLQISATVCYEVYGMDCPGCESALEKQINKLDGIKNVEASWEKQQVLIWFDEKKQPDEGEIIKRIKKANFTPGEKIQLEDKDEK